MQQKATRRKRSAKLKPDPSKEKAVGAQNNMIKTQQMDGRKHFKKVILVISLTG